MALSESERGSFRWEPTNIVDPRTRMETEYPGDPLGSLLDEDIFGPEDNELPELSSANNRHQIQYQMRQGLFHRITH